MRHSSFGLIVFAGVLTNGCQDADSMELTKVQIDSNGYLTGQARRVPLFVAWADGTPARHQVGHIQGDGIGGACIVGDFTDVWGFEKCEVHTDCNFQAAQDAQKKAKPWLGSAPVFPNGIGYCIDKKCWYRPGNQRDLCTVGPLQQNQWVTIGNGGLDANTVLLGGKLPNPGRIEWRLHGCLNSKETDGHGDTGQIGCNWVEKKPGSRVEFNGPIALLP